MTILRFRIMKFKDGFGNPIYRLAERKLWRWVPLTGDSTWSLYWWDSSKEFDSLKQAQTCRRIVINTWLANERIFVR